MKPPRALTLTQPWAWLVVNGHKPIENRRWHLWRPMVGAEVLIHASARMTRIDYEDVVDLAAQIDPSIALPAFGDIERGGIVGAVRITGCLCPTGEQETMWKRPDDHPWWFRNQHGFTLENARTLPFVACKGSLGFWEVSADLRGQVSP